MKPGFYRKSGDTQHYAATSVHSPNGSVRASDYSELTLNVLDDWAYCTSETEAVGALGWVPEKADVTYRYGLGANGHILVVERVDGSAEAHINWDAGYDPSPEEVAAAEARASDPARLADYAKRGQVSQRIMDGWSAYNDKKIIDGEWGGADLLSFFAAITPVTTLLFSNGFGACRDTILRFDHVYATPQAKYEYLQIMKSEYPSLPVPTLAEIEAMGEE